MRIVTNGIGIAGLALLAACGSEQSSVPVEVTIETLSFSSQAEVGATAFASNCAACHGANLEGTTLGPLLSGFSFLQRWGTQTPALLLNNIQTNMPPGGNEGISDEDYLNIVAHILNVNGVDGAITALEADTDFPIAENISRIANQQRREPEPPQGITIAGTVENYVPITDTMLENPDPGDWPMLRRNYYAHSYSPLDQINTDNVGGMTLEWVWSMHDGGSEPAPLVYNGIIYLINSGNVIQALDAASGEMIWEHWTGPANRQDMRNIAIYNDKIIQATTDARLVALDARTGEQVWETIVADNTKGFSNSSGPIVADGKIIQGLTGCGRYTEDDCYISAHDANTGELEWRFVTIAKAGEPGGDTWGRPDRYLPRRRRYLDYR